MKILEHELSRRQWQQRAVNNGIKRTTFLQRLTRGWSYPKAATTPTVIQRPRGDHHGRRKT